MLITENRALKQPLYDNENDNVQNKIGSIEQMNS